MSPRRFAAHAHKRQDCVLHPLDLGIIKNLKVWYRKLLFRHVLAKMKDCMTASEVTKSHTIIHAIRSVAEAWKQVSSDTSRNAFERISEEKDPFSNIDENNEDNDGVKLSDLISNFMAKMMLGKSN